MRKHLWSIAALLVMVFLAFGSTSGTSSAPSGKSGAPSSTPSSTPSNTPSSAPSSMSSAPATEVDIAKLKAVRQKIEAALRLAEYIHAQVFTPGVSEVGGFSIIVVSAESIFVPSRKLRLARDAWLLLAVGAVGKYTRESSLPFKALIVTDVDGIKQNRGYSIPISFAQSLQQQIYDGRLELEDAFSQIDSKMEPYTIDKNQLSNEGTRLVLADGRTNEILPGEGIAGPSREELGNEPNLQNAVKPPQIEDTLQNAVKPPKTIEDTFSGECVGVTDGDTISVMREGHALKIRLNGIDCPESSQAFGSKAKQFSSGLVFGKNVQVTPTDTDRYGRIVADVFTEDGKCLNRELVAAGLAWWYRQYSKDETLGALEETAREAKAGLWSESAPTPPWNFRHTPKPDEPRTPARNFRYVPKQADEDQVPKVSENVSASWKLMSKAETKLRTGDVIGANDTLNSILRTFPESHEAETIRRLIRVVRQKGEAEYQEDVSSCNTEDILKLRGMLASIETIASIYRTAPADKREAIDTLLGPGFDQPNLTLDGILNATLQLQRSTRLAADELAGIHTTSKPAPKTSISEGENDTIVYVTRTGSKYHRSGCRYLSKSRIPMNLNNAKQRYGPCSVCSPPR